MTTLAPMPAQNPEASAARALRSARRLAGLTQEEAARKLAVTSRTYARWERGETAGFLRELDRIAEAFGTTPDAIIGGGVTDALEDRLGALEGELRQLRSLLLDPQALRRAAEALADDEDAD